MLDTDWLSGCDHVLTSALARSILAELTVILVFYRVDGSTHACGHLGAREQFYLHAMACKMYSNLRKTARPTCASPTFLGPI